MKQFKNQIIGVICATVLTLIAIFAFKMIAQFYSAGFGEFAKESTQLAIEKHFGPGVKSCVSEIRQSQEEVR